MELPNPESHGNPLSFRQLCERYLKDRRQRVNLRSGGISARTYMNNASRLQAILKRFPDADKPGYALNYAALRSVYESFLQSREISNRTAYGYCSELRSFLNWAADMEEIDLPRGWQRLPRLPRPQPTISLVRYDPALLIAIRQQCEDQDYLFMLLGLLGLFQHDIAGIRFPSAISGKLDGSHPALPHSHLVRIHETRLVPLAYDEIRALNGDTDVYIYRALSPNRHNGPRTLTWLFPEATTLIGRCLAARDNSYCGCLLTPNGQPLVRFDIASAVSYDYIGRHFAEAVRKAQNQRREAASASGKELPEDDGSHLTFKSLRKIGAVAVHRLTLHDRHEVLGMYLNRQPLDSHWVYPDYDHLTAALKRWADQLRSDRVLVSNPLSD
jgi:hypothetical protein